MRKNRYIVLIACMMIQLCAGIIYMWSVFNAPVSAYLGWHASAAAFTSSIMLAFFVIGIITGGRIQDRMGPKRVTAAGSICISAGMLLTSFITPAAPWLVYITYGMIGGFGVGCVYTCTISTVQKWFPDKRGFASGMIVAAFGFSLVLFSPMAKAMLAALGVPVTFRIFGGIFLVICLICTSFITTPQEAQLSINSGANANRTAEGKQYTTAEMLRTRQFWFIASSMFFLLPAYFILNPLLLSLGAERGLSESAALSGVMITGICSASGRLIIAWLSDRMGCKSAILCTGVIMLAGGILMIFAEGAWFLVCVGGIAFAFGGSSGVYSVITSASFGTKNAGTNFGCVMLAFGLSALLSPRIANALQSTGGATASFLFASVTTGISLVLMFFIKEVKQKAKKSG